MIEKRNLFRKSKQNVLQEIIQEQEKVSNDPKIDTPINNQFSIINKSSYYKNYCNTNQFTFNDQMEIDMNQKEANVTMSYSNENSFFASNTYHNNNNIKLNNLFNQCNDYNNPLFLNNSYRYQTLNSLSNKKTLRNIIHSSPTQLRKEPHTKKIRKTHSKYIY